MNDCEPSAEPSILKWEVLLNVCVYALLILASASFWLGVAFAGRVLLP